MKLGRRPPEEPRRRPLPTTSSRRPNYSYYTRSRADDEQSMQRARRQPIPRSKKEIARYLGQRFGAILAIIAVLALAISSVQVSMQPRLQIVNDTAVYRLHSDNTYEAAIEQSLRSSWTNTNKLTINTAKIADDLKRAYPEVADASVAIPVLGQRPIVYIQLTRPSLVLVGNDNSAVVLDEKGRALASASQVDNLDSFNLPSVVDQSGLPVHAGQLALSSDAVSFIRTVTYEFNAAHVTYSRLVLPPASQELDVYIAGAPYYVKFNLHDDDSVKQQVGQFLATETYLQRQGKAPTAYVDARLPGRIYYK